MQKKILVLILIVILAVALCACGSMSGMTRPLVAPGAEMKTIEGEVKAEISGDKIIVSATTNIIDGAIIKLSIHTTNGAELASTTVTKNGDNLKAEFNASVLGEEKSFYAFASCAPEQYGKQSDAMAQEYGKQFEMMDGKHVVYDMSSVIAVISSEEIKVK